MYTNEILETVLNQNGVLTQSQYISIYDNSPQITCVFLNEDNEYWFEMYCSDKKEPILFNVKTEFGITGR